MRPEFVFYIHHHGSGHLMRALAIAASLPKGTVTFMGSDLDTYQQIIPDHIGCIQLPEDVAREEDLYAIKRELDFLHYAPLNIKGAAERAALICAVLVEKYPVMLIIDVSVEITLLAAISGIPAMVIRQNGNRNDIPHLNAYQSAQMLIAPCSRELMNRSGAPWVDNKTFFSGGFSRYTGRAKSQNVVVKNSVAVMTGSGGTSLDAGFLFHLAEQCPAKMFQVIGNIILPERYNLPKNVTVHGKVSDPYQLLNTCEVVIGNGGHNTVMEMADLDKRFICIPEERPFAEQTEKAKLLQKHQMAVVVEPTELMYANWHSLIDQALNLPDNRWEGVINPDALTDIAAMLLDHFNNNFPDH